MLTENQQRGIELANRVIADPSLLTQLDDDTFIKFVISLTKISKDLGKEVFDLRENVSSENKILFWEAIGILMPICNEEELL